ncbi:multicomponent Na+:H+ antiporter subunit F [Conyzicola lurida]|uniref:Multicomponent Na+:H+ antiporter subunit F n=1 Tax=Conyzicola lurida TaxID=1172621 RepID=A0A841ARQ0_9MICO|nr:multicomponent Na+:H+ antiporter subunit F [Conyzicola lurida]
MSIIYLIIGALFTIAALFTVYRIVRGPSILDRMIASDVLLTTLMLMVGAEMVYNGHTRTIPLMVVLSSTAIFATIAVARYVSKQDRPDGIPVGADSSLGASASATDETPDTEADAATGRQER